MRNAVSGDRRTVARNLALIGAAALCLHAANIVGRHWLMGVPIHWPSTPLRALPGFVIWLGLGWLVVRLAQLISPERIGWLRTLLLHLLAAMACAVVYGLLRGALAWLSGDVITLGAGVSIHTVRAAPTSLLIYAGIAASAVAFGYRGIFLIQTEQREAVEQRLDSLIRAGSNEPDDYVTRLTVRAGQRTVTVDVDEIDWIEADGNYAALHTAGRTYLLRQTMKALERSLDPASFIRVDRSAIVNLARVRECRSAKPGEHLIVLSDGTTVRASRGGRLKLKALQRLA